jgi:Cu/Zn superoxide dismutase
MDIMMRQIIARGFTAILIGVTPALAGEVTVSTNKNSADGIGSITLKGSHHGMMPVAQAFHIHKNLNFGAGMVEPHGNLPDNVVKVEQFRGRAIMVHWCGNNEASKAKDDAARFACGIISE